MVEVIPLSNPFSLSREFLIQKADVYATAQNLASTDTIIYTVPSGQTLVLYNFWVTVHHSGTVPTSIAVQIDSTSIWTFDIANTSGSNVNISENVNLVPPMLIKAGTQIILASSQAYSNAGLRGFIAPESIVKEEFGSEALPN